MPSRNPTAAERKAARASVAHDIKALGHFPKEHVDKARPDEPPHADVHGNPPEGKLNGRWRDVDGSWVKVKDDGADEPDEDE